MDFFLASPKQNVCLIFGIMVIEIGSFWRENGHTTLYFRKERDNHKETPCNTFLTFTEEENNHRKWQLLCSAEWKNAIQHESHRVRLNVCLSELKETGIQVELNTLFTALKTSTSFLTLSLSFSFTAL